MEDSKLYLGTLFASVVALCMSVYLTLSSSHMFILFDLMYLCWIIGVTVHTIKWCKSMKIKDCIKLIKPLNISIVFFLIAGFVNALFSLSQTYSVITTVIGTFCFCCFFLSLIIVTIIKHRKQAENDGNWIKKADWFLGKYIQ